MKYLKRLMIAVLIVLHSLLFVSLVVPFIYWFITGEDWGDLAEDIVWLLED